MGRKPALGLVGACLASVAFVGCDNPNNLQPNKNKDVSAAATGSGNNGWRTPTTSQGTTSTGGAAGSGTSNTPSWGNMASGSGNAVAGSNGSFNVNTKAPTDDYPPGRSMVPPAGGTTAGVERVGYSSTPGADMSAGKAPLPPVTAGSSGSGTGTGGLPPLAGTPGGFNPKAPAPLSTFPPIVTSGPAQPKMQDFPPAPTGPRPTTVPTTTGAPTSGAPDLGGTGTVPPPMPVPAAGPDLGAPTDLPPIPAPPSTDALKKPALPSAPLPRNVGVPAPAGANPASFQ